MDYLPSPNSLSFLVELVSAFTLTWYQSHKSRVQILGEVLFCASTHLFPHLRIFLWLHVSEGVEVYKWIIYLLLIA
jgi:hypothetical protein